MFSDMEGGLGYSCLGLLLEPALPQISCVTLGKSHDPFGLRIWGKASYLLSQANIVSFLVMAHGKEIVVL